MRFAYADPPYLGCCHFYDHYHPDGLCWDNIDTHKLLINRLVNDYPDGWALSASSPSLHILLPMCSPNVRIAAWVKPFCIFKKGVRPAYAWEPVLFYGGRNRNHPPPPKGGKQTTPKDFISENIMLETGMTGAKPFAFCTWILDLLGYVATDTLDELYPATKNMELAIKDRRINGSGSTLQLG